MEFIETQQLNRCKAWYGTGPLSPHLRPPLPPDPRSLRGVRQITCIYVILAQVSLTVSLFFQDSAPGCAVRSIMTLSIRLGIHINCLFCKLAPVSKRD